MRYKATYPQNKWEQDKDLRWDKYIEIDANVVVQAVCDQIEQRNHVCVYYTMVNQKLQVERQVTKAQQILKDQPAKHMRDIYTNVVS